LVEPEFLTAQIAFSQTREISMGRSILLLLLGVPIPIIILIALISR
jgi:hypothetical protein